MDKGLQKQFVKFHEEIRLDFDDSSILREKRDLLINELRAYLKKIAEDNQTPLITFENFNQGSYGMGIGIKSMPNEDYDIDVALVFHFATKDIGPLAIKLLIYAALNKGNRTVLIKKPCVRVQYHKDGSESFHVDIASYSDKYYNLDDKYYLARGIEKEPKSQFWEQSGPKDLKAQFQALFEGDDHKQFVRVIRSMKRWKDNNFSATGSERPIGIGITVCAMKWFSPEKEWTDVSQYNYNDCLALRNLVHLMLDNFSNYISKDGKSKTLRLVVRLSVLPQNDLFEKMTDAEMENFRKKLIRLRDSLNIAMEEKSLKKACKILESEFGEDFHVPDEDEEAKAVNTAFSANLLGLSGKSPSFPVLIKNRGGFYGRQ